MTFALSHPELLARANKVRAAATDHDLERLPTHRDLLRLVREVQAAAVVPEDVRLAHAVRRLRDQLEVHVAGERRDRGPRPSAVERALHRGQERLLSLVASLEGESCQDSVRPCVVRLAELAALLRRQAAMEHRMSRMLDLRKDVHGTRVAAAVAPRVEQGHPSSPPAARASWAKQ